MRFDPDREYGDQEVLGKDDTSEWSSCHVDDPASVCFF